MYAPLFGVWRRGAEAGAELLDIHTHMASATTTTTMHTEQNIYQIYAAPLRSSNRWSLWSGGAVCFPSCEAADLSRKRKNVRRWFDYCLCVFALGLFFASVLLVSVTQSRKLHNLRAFH